MKILFLNSSAQLGGAEQSLLDIIASLREAVPEWEFHLVVGANGPLVNRAIALGAKVILLPFPRALARLGDSSSNTNGTRGERIQKMLVATPEVANYVLRLRRIVKTLSPDLIHSNGQKMHLLGVWSRLKRTPVIWHIRDYLGPRPFMAQLMSAHVDRCAAVFANSASVARDVREVCGEDVVIHTLHNRIDLDYFSPEPANSKLDLDQLSGLSPVGKEIVRVGLIATLARWKGHEVFLRALSLLRGLPLRGYVIGGAIYETEGSQHSLSQLREKAEAFGLNGGVGFTGWVSDPAAAMRALDIVVHASTEPEPFGRVIVEGMACGKAVVSSNAGGAAELIDEGQNALIFTPGDAVMLARQIESLVKNASLRSTLGKTARVTAEQRFNRCQLAAELIPIYRKCMNQ